MVAIVYKLCTLGCEPRSSGAIPDSHPNPIDLSPEADYTVPRTPCNTLL